MATKDLERYGSGGLCDIPRIRTEVGRSSTATTNLILNGVTVYRDFDVASLCSWRADEVELVEFNSHICKDLTQSVAAILNLWCVGGSNVPRSMMVEGGPVSTQGVNGSYVIIWEKR